MKDSFRSTDCQLIEHISMTVINSTQQEAKYLVTVLCKKIIKWFFMISKSLRLITYADKLID